MSNSRLPASPSLLPDYGALVKFLIQPFLESPDSFKVDCEPPNQQGRVWIRVAFDGDEKGRFFGRGGRNLQSIRAVLAAAAAAVGQSAYLDIYDGSRDSGRAYHPQRRKRPSALSSETPPPYQRRRSRSLSDPSAPPPYSF
ncbi:MAG: KH domain-containing protein [Cyanobacteriota bacterium]